jgi:imidazolonepropionase-like amidohydrolase
MSLRNNAVLYKKSLMAVYTPFLILVVTAFISFEELEALPDGASSERSVLMPNASSNKNLILYNANLIDGIGQMPRYNETIIVNEDKIIDIIDGRSLPENSVKFFYQLYPNASIVDLSGRFVIPGLFDMHAHVAGVHNNSFNSTFSEEMINLLLAYGVTTIRNPGGPTMESVELKEAVSNGSIEGPQIFTAGRLLNSFLMPIPFVETKIDSEDDIKEEIYNQAKAGVDFIKVYVGLKPEFVQKAIDVAHSLGIRVIGHLYLTSWTDAAKMNIDYLTHGVPVNPYLLTQNKRDIFEKTAGSPFNHFLWLELVDVEGEEIKDMISVLVKNNVYVDPTLSIYEAMIKDEKSGRDYWSKVLSLTKKMYDKGVKILPGTDIPNFGLVPGKSLHNELALLVDAGIPADEVIKIATRNSAESLGILNETGTIEKGKQADLVVLSSNPIDKIQNVGDIEKVINNGQIVDREKILSRYNTH